MPCMELAHTSGIPHAWFPLVCQYVRFKETNLQLTKLLGETSQGPQIGMARVSRFASALCTGDERAESARSRGSGGGCRALSERKSCLGFVGRSRCLSGFFGTPRVPFSDFFLVSKTTKHVVQSPSLTL